MPAADQIFELRLRNDLSELSRLDDWISHVAERLSLGEKAAYSVRLCLVEAVTNVIVHGGGGASSTGILLIVTAEKDLVTARVTDSGRPFDPTSYVPNPTSRSLQEGGIGGQGIRLMRRFAASLSYERRANQNSLILTFDR
jgi:anti-sigma regulatory factor (Ser/Thr protein kinase)